MHLLLLTRLLRNSYVMKTDTHHLDRTLSLIADFYDDCKVGYEGFEGYRKSTDLDKFIECAKELEALQLINRQHTILLDLGCADGRVNVLMSYFVDKSVGIEIDPDILNEYQTHTRDLNLRLNQAGLDTLPSNISLFAGNILGEDVFHQIFEDTWIRLEEVDLFYTYNAMHYAFAERISTMARRRALYLVYGFNKVLPRYDGFELLIPDVASQEIFTLYSKKT